MSLTLMVLSLVLLEDCPSSPDVHQAGDDWSRQAKTNPNHHQPWQSLYELNLLSLTWRLIWVRGAHVDLTSHEGSRLLQFLPPGE